MADRAAELAAGLEQVRSRVAAACAEVGREPREVTLVVVTKTWPATDVRLLAELGVRDVAENKHQEAEAKAAECADLDLTWHFVGALQSNKAAAVARYAHAVHSLDRSKLVGPLDRGAADRDRPVDVLLQVSLDPVDRAHRAGASASVIAELADRVDDAEALALRGLMAVAPLDVEPATAFARLAEIHHELLIAHPTATWLSAGMSNDLEEAVKAGATHVRVGSAVLGSRGAKK